MGRQPNILNAARGVNDRVGDSPNIRRLRRCAHAVVFETGVRATPFSVAGTAFLVRFHNSLFLLTARHVVLNVPKEHLAIIVSPSGERLRLRERWNIRVEGGEHDESDLVIFRTDPSGLSTKTRRSNTLIDLTSTNVADWFDDRDTAVFFLFGYPKTVTEPDYERSKVDKNQTLLHGSYIGHSIVDGCFELSVQNPLALPSFDGMSGSPVFSLSTVLWGRAQPKFCGMALRGTTGSGRVHFLGSETILNALSAAHAAP